MAVVKTRSLLVDRWIISKLFAIEIINYSPLLFPFSLFPYCGIKMMSYAAYYSLIVLSIVDVLPVEKVYAGPLDNFSWARVDKIPIDVNLPWLPCKYSRSVNSRLFMTFSCTRRVLKSYEMRIRQPDRIT